VLLEEEEQEEEEEEEEEEDGGSELDAADPEALLPRTASRAACVVAALRSALRHSSAGPMSDRSSRSWCRLESEHKTSSTRTVDDWTSAAAMATA
jgi:hypothetical protein